MIQEHQPSRLPSHLRLAAWLGLVLGLTGGALRADTLVFQEGAFPFSGTTDTWLQASASTANYGAASLIEWDGSDNGGQNFALIRFDDILGTSPGQIQPTDQITSATLEYEIINYGDQGSVHEILVDWDPPTPTTYANFGGTFGVQANEYGAALAPAPGSYGTRSFEVTASLAAWASNPTANRGWIIRPTGSNGVEFYSSEWPVIGQRPKLTVVVNEGPAPVTVTRGPYLQTATSTSMIVRWRTSEPTSTGVFFGTQAGVLDQQTVDAALTTDHEVELTGLAPDTQYFYAVGTDTATLTGDTPEHLFFTAPTPGTSTPTRIWAIGDFGIVDDGQLSMRDAYYAFAGSQYTDVWLMLGDNAYDDGTDLQYQAAVFEVYHDLLLQTPFWSTRGNHEVSSSTYYSLTTNPTGGEAGGVASGSEAYYSFDHANIHFVCLDSQGSSRSPTGPMLTWLQADLANTTQEWIIAYWHHPPYTKGSHDSDDVTDSGGRMRDMRQNALPILEAAGVDLVLGGHSHVYERSYLIDSHYGTSGTWNPATMQLDGGDGDPAGDGAYEKEALPHDGTVYIVMGSSGRLSTSGPLNHPAMQHSVALRGSLVIDVTGGTLHAQMVRENGVLQDMFTIVKTPALPSFRRGDSNGDGQFDIADAIKLLGDLFNNDVPNGCDKACDSNDDGAKDIADTIHVLNNLFTNGPAPGSPFPDCGTDPTPDGLGCTPAATCP